MPANARPSERGLGLIAYNKYRPSRASATPAKMIDRRTPINGMRTCTISSTPMMAPSVLVAYTRPICFSPPPRRNSARVKSGKVMPAKKAAGNITSNEITALPALNSV